MSGPGWSGFAPGISSAPEGGVRLSWSPVAAPDLLRYRVHRVPLTTLHIAAELEGGIQQQTAEANLLQYDRPTMMQAWLP